MEFTWKCADQFCEWEPATMSIYINGAFVGIAVSFTMAKTVVNQILDQYEFARYYC